MLHEIAKKVNLQHSPLIAEEYFELLDWADVYRLATPDRDPSKEGVGLGIDGAKYALLFLTSSAAANAASKLSAEVVPAGRGRDVLSRLVDGQGLIVDWDSSAEVRIGPQELTELSERIRIKVVRQEATVDWLASLDSAFDREALPQGGRAERAMQLWALANSFRVIPGSRRETRIRRYFSPANAASLTEDDYKGSSKLSYLSQDLLAARLRTIVVNLSFARRSADPHERDALDWIELLQEVAFEYRRRGSSLLEACATANVNAKWPREALANDAWRSAGSPRGGLYKFGWREHLEPTLKEGLIKVFPSSCFEDPSVHPALRDDEASRQLVLDPGQTTMTFVGPGGAPQPLVASGPITVTTKFESYYLWCTTTGFSPRLFDDFEYNACLVFRDPKELTNRIFAAADAQWSGWMGASKLVRYYDPIRWRWNQFFPHHKNFKCEYQREFRFLWEARSAKDAIDLKPRDLRLGSLEDIAVLLTI
jgi:hypothetical protein